MASSIYRMLDRLMPIERFRPNVALHGDRELARIMRDNPDLFIGFGPDPNDDDYANGIVLGDEPGVAIIWTGAPPRARGKIS